MRVGRLSLPGLLRRAVAGRPMLQRVLHNSLWQVGDKISRMGAGVLVSVLIGRHLGPADFGLLNFAVALTALFSAIAAFGLPSVIVRDVISRPQERDIILGSALLLRLIGGATALALVVLTVQLIGCRDSTAIVLIAGLAVLPQAWDVIDYDYQARLQARSIVIARNTAFATLAVLRVTLVLLGAPVIWFAWALCGEAALNALLFIRRSRADGFSIALSAATRQELRRLAATSWPLVIAGLSVSVYMRIDQVMLGQMMGNLGVGMFSAAVRVSEALYFLPVAIATSVAPALTALYHRSTAEYERRFLQVTRTLFWAALGVALVFAVFSKPIVLALYGVKYAAAAPVLAIHAWAGVLVSLGVCGTLWLTNAGYLTCSMYQTLVGAAVNVGLNLVLIPRFGLIGAACASVGGQFASVMLTAAALPKTRRLFRLQLAAMVPAF